MTTFLRILTLAAVLAAPTLMQAQLLTRDAQGRLTQSQHDVYDDDDILRVRITYIYDTQGVVAVRSLTQYNDVRQPLRVEQYTPDDVLLYAEDNKYDRQHRLVKSQRLYYQDGAVDKSTETRKYRQLSDGTTETIYYVDGREVCRTIAAPRSAEITHSRVAQLLMAIPDHDCVSESSRQLMTLQLFEALQAACAIPTMPGVIGDEEFLYYFVSGNGGGIVDSHSITIAKQVELDSLHTAVSVTYGYVDVEATNTVSMRLEFDGKEWLLADFDDCIAKCAAYLQNSLSDYRSGKSVQIMREMGASDEEIKTYVDAYNAFLGKHAEKVNPKSR